MFNPKQWLGSLINAPPVDPNSIEILFEKLKSGHIDTRKAISEVEEYSSNSQCIQVVYFFVFLSNPTHVDRLLERKLLCFSKCLGNISKMKR
jgi:hypothetical protein